VWFCNNDFVVAFRTTVNVKSNSYNGSKLLMGDECAELVLFKE